MLFKLENLKKAGMHYPRFTAQNKEGVSVLVAARDEAENIAVLLSDLSQQTHENLEIIVIDDHSTDDTVKIVESFTNVILLQC